MNILQVSRGQRNALSAKGEAIETLILNLSAHLSRMGHRVTILDNSYSKGEPDTEYYEGVEIIRLRAKQFHLRNTRWLPAFFQFLLDEFGTFLFALKVSRFLKRNSSDFEVVNIHLTLIGFVLSILNRKCFSKVLYTNHSSLWALNGNQLNTLHKVTLFLDSYFMRRAGRIIIPTDLLKEKLVSVAKVKPQNIVVMPNAGVDVGVPDISDKIEEVKKRYEIKDRVSVLFVGRLAVIKGIEYLVRAVNIIVNEFQIRNMVLLVVGPTQSPHSVDKPVNMPSLLNYIEANKLKQHIIFTGAIYEGLEELYAACDMLVLPSLADLIPRTIIEAMVYTKPVVGTRVGGIPALIKDKWNGLLVDPADERQLAETIRYLVENPEERARMGANDRRYVEEEFDWKKVATRYSSIYQQLKEQK